MSGALRRDLARFTAGRLIGRGYASRVYEARDAATGATVALKVYRKAKLCPLNFHQIRREVRIHAAFSHPGILALYAAFEDDGAIYLALEHCAKGDLYNYLRQRGTALTESQARPFAPPPSLTSLPYPIYVAFEPSLRGSTCGSISPECGRESNQRE